ncbi:MAG: hypothetical protein KGJ02_04740 [Verrucomicrobiota bacterium]|nr:hypothetical protein [Verrucomicrobiota bacterium]
MNLVAVETLGKQRIHQQFIARSRLDRTYREGFWTYTTQRFFYLADFMHQNGLSDVFHLESDVMLYANIGELLPHCQAHYANMIAVPSDCDARCIASFIYVANVTPLDAFLQFVTDKVRDIDNDMHFLAHFRHRYFQVYIDHFPVIFPDYAKDHALISRFGDVTATPERYMSYFDDFQAVFDAAAIGQYLGGIDPRNGESVPGFVNESTLFNVADFQYEWIADEKGRKVPHMIYQGQKIKINNLHIHSKRLDAFKS